MSDTWHVMPVNDLIEHEDHDCACLPTTEPVKRDNGSMGWVVVHNSFDGREVRERARTREAERRARYDTRGETL